LQAVFKTVTRDGDDHYFLKKPPEEAAFFISQFSKKQ